MAEKQPITFFACDPVAALHKQLEADCMAEEARLDFEADLDREQQLFWEEPEEQEHEVIPATAVMDWDFYRKHF